MNLDSNLSSLALEGNTVNNINRCFPGVNTGICCTVLGDPMADGTMLCSAGDAGVINTVFYMNVQCGGLGHVLPPPLISLGSLLNSVHCSSPAQLKFFFISLGKLKPFLNGFGAHWLMPSVQEFLNLSSCQSHS